MWSLVSDVIYPTDEHLYCENNAAEKSRPPWKVVRSRTDTVYNSTINLISVLYVVIQGTYRLRNIGYRDHLKCFVTYDVG